MSANTNIEWTDRTWSVTRGCSVVSPGCHQCYAMKMAHRFSKPGMPFHGLTKATSSGPQWTGTVRSLPGALLEPLSWRKPQRVFVNSMSDLFHEDVPWEFLDRVFAVMARAKQHTFQVLTKRADRMRDYMTHADTPWRIGCEEERLNWAEEVADDVDMSDVSLAWPPMNVWLGVSVEDQQRADERIPLLLQTPAAVRFLSCEPLLGPLDLGLSQAVCGCCPRIFSSRWVRVNRRLEADFPLNIVGARAGMSIEPGVHRAVSNRHGALSVNSIGIRPSEFDTLPSLDWVIAGGESGPGARPCDVAWIRSIVTQCQAAGVSVFVKQLGARPFDGSIDRASVDYSTHAVGAIDGLAYLRHIENRKGGNPSEWPEDLRVREFPR